MANWSMILLKSIIAFFLVLAAIRILGTSSPLRVTPYKLVTFIVVAIVAALTSTGIIANPVYGIIVIAAWSLMAVALDYLCTQNKYIHDLMTGKETIIVKDGKVMEENLSKIRATAEDLLGELRSKNAFSLADVEFAVMESTGELNVLLKSDKKPVTAHDLQKKVDPLSEPQTVILNGKIMYDSLAATKFNKDWLNAELEKIGVAEQNVFIGQIDSSGTLYVDLFDDKLQVPQFKLKELLYANIEKCYADLSTYALETDNEKAKNMYLKDAEKLKKMMDKLEPYLLR